MMPHTYHPTEQGGCTLKTSTILLQPTRHKIKEKEKKPIFILNLLTGLPSHHRTETELGSLVRLWWGPNFKYSNVQN